LLIGRRAKTGLNLWREYPCVRRCGGSKTAAVRMLQCWVLRSSLSLCPFPRCPCVGFPRCPFVVCLVVLLPKGGFCLPLLACCVVVRGSGCLTLSRAYIYIYIVSIRFDMCSYEGGDSCFSPPVCYVALSSVVPVVLISPSPRAQAGARPYVFLNEQLVQRLVVAAHLPLSYPKFLGRRASHFSHLRS